jgi:hypothetical protein
LEIATKEATGSRTTGWTIVLSNEFLDVLDDLGVVCGSKATEHYAMLCRIPGCINAMMAPSPCAFFVTPSGLVNEVVLDMI